MRHVISISLKEETVLKLKDKIRNSDIFRNKSHAIEYAINKLLREE